MSRRRGHRNQRKGPALSPDQMRAKWVNWVTVHSDASLSEGRARYAFALRTDRAPYHLRLHGDLPRKVVDVNVAEACALLFGIRVAIWKWYDGPGSIQGWFLRSDSKTVIDLVNGARSRNELIDRAGAALRGTLRQVGGEINARHVRGHQDPNKGTRFYMNNLCDMMASQR